MPEYAILIKRYLEDEGLSCRNAAAMCGINRTSLTKYLNGTRTPKNVDIIRRIGEGIGMDIGQVQLLCESYEQSRLKTEKKAAYRMVESIYMGGVSGTDKSYLSYMNNGIITTERLTGCLHSKKEVLNAIMYMTRDTSKVMMCMDMEYPEIPEILSKTCGGNRNCEIEQFIVIGRNYLEQENQCIYFEKMAALLLSNAVCRIHCRDCPGTMPVRGENRMNYIVTDKGVVLFDTELTGGICACGDNCRSYYRRKFKLLCADSWLFAYNTREQERAGAFTRICNPFSGMEFVHYCGMKLLHVIYRGSTGREHSFYIREERMIKVIRNFMEVHRTLT